MKIESVCILGGSGFVGGHLVNRLRAAGLRCTVATRRPHRHRELQLGGVRVAGVSSFDRRELTQLFEGHDAVINLVGILNSGLGGRFETVHVGIATVAAQSARDAGARRLLHMSALNADPDGPSEYLRSKGRAERAVTTNAGAELGVTIFRPSVIFGPDDHFFNRFAGLLRLPGFLPLACPGARFAPVYVGDVAEAFARALRDPHCAGEIYELCGPEAMTLREVVDYTARHLHIEKPIIGLGDGVSRFQARVLGWMPGKPFTLDNYASLRKPSLCESNGLNRLGIDPTPVDAVMPLELEGQRMRLRYNRFRKLLPAFLRRRES